MTQAKHMTEGSISKNIITFAIPVFCGQLFQQLYNVVDSLVVGNVLGTEALAAVTSSGSLVFLLVGLFSGIFIGAGVVVSRAWGAKDHEAVSRAVHTMLAFGILSGIFLTVVGVALTPHILGLMHIAPNVLPNSISYFRIYFSGVLTIILFNVTNGIFQAVGDSRHPLFFLIVSSCTNVVLDIIFVKYIGMGVDGAALATVISQGVSAYLGLRYLARSTEAFRISLRKIRMHKRELMDLLHMGIPSGIQNSIISLANIVVQTHVNAYGEFAMAGCGAYSKIEGFGFLPVTSFSMALTTFIGQNLGAKQYDRAKRGARFGVLCCISLAQLMGILIYVFSPLFISAFGCGPEAIAFGVRQAHTVTLFYFLLSYSHAMAGVFRGAGKAIVPMVVMMVCWCIIRVTYVTLAVPLPDVSRMFVVDPTVQTLTAHAMRIVPVHVPPSVDIRVLFACYPITWTLSSICFTVYFFKADWVHTFEKKQLKA